MKTFIFLVSLLIFVSTESVFKVDITQELDSVPQFVQLAQNPISQGFLSLASLHMRTTTNLEDPNNAGYAKVMYLVNELIRNNRNQLQEIIRINHRVEGQCMVSKSNLKNRAANFKQLYEYFKLKAKTSLKEKTESIDMRNSRKIHINDYTTAHNRLKAQHAEEMKFWLAREKTSNDAIVRSDAAIKAVTEWKPNTSHAFVETAINEAISFYQKATKFPLEFDHTFVQLAANDFAVKRRLYEWLNMLKATLVQVLGTVQMNKAEVSRHFLILNDDLTKIVRLLNQDVKRLDLVINNVERLINNYNSNEKIYTALLSQTNRVIQASKVWCRVEVQNFNQSKVRMQEQLEVFNELRVWFRRNFGRVRAWIAKKYGF